jgi:hypothetical protein
MLVRPALFLAPIILCGCATSRVHERAPLPTRTCQVACEGSIGHEPIRDDEFAPPEPAVGAARDFVARVRLGRLRSDVAASLVGADARGVEAHVVSSAALDWALQPHGELPVSAEVVATAGRPGVLRTVAQRSYIESFRFEAVQGASIVDPVVGTYVTGNVLTVLPMRAEVGGTWTLEVALQSIDVVHPVGVQRFDAFGAGLPLAVQVPMFARVKASTSATLASGESLVLLAPEPLRTEEVLVAIVTPAS